MSDKYHLYFDDTGSRTLNKSENNNRRDGMDCFGLGRIIIREKDIPEVLEKHQKFLSKWKISAPLHSTKIRGNRGQFSQFGKDEALKKAFLEDLNNYIVRLPIIVTGAIIHRPGYYDRYHSAYKNNIWEMSKSAFYILVERSVKHVADRNGQLEIYFEQAGKIEDRNILEYFKQTKENGSPFSQENSSGYSPLSNNIFQDILIRNTKTKN